MLDLHLAGFADLAEVQGDHQLADLAVIHDASGDFGKGVADLTGECTTVQLFKELGGICCDWHSVYLE